MRVLHQDPKEGEIRLKIQNADDLWHLHNLLEPGDLVRAYTYRRDEAALIAQVRQMGIREVAVIRADPHGKMFPGSDTRVAYFQEILSKLAAMDLGSALLVVGPGFEREEFSKFVRDKKPELAEKIRLHGTSQAGMAGIQEAMKAGLGAKILEETP